MIPGWLHLLSIVALVVGFGCAAIVAIDEIRHPQPMWIMNIVWPLVAMFGGLPLLWFYWRHGRPAGKKAKEKPFPVSVAEAACHCGSGCTLGDICAEWLAFAYPAVAVSLGWHTIFQERIYAVWILDFVFAFAFGIAFQYFTIVPMRNLRPLQGIAEAVKADALSLTAWQLGMYGFMAFASFYLFRRVLGAELATDSVEFWFMMQLAMLCGFATSYPANWWLLRAGIKEPM